MDAKIKLKILVISSFIGGLLIQHIWDLIFLKKLEEERKNIKKCFRSFQIFLIPYKPFEDGIWPFKRHKKGDPPKEYKWRYPKPHPGGRPENPMDAEALELLDKGKSKKEAFEIVAPKHHKESILENSHQKNILFENFRKRINRKLKKLRKEGQN
jgi:hypothetical protein